MGVRVQALNPRDTPLGVGFGAIITVALPQPAAGADYATVTVPANRIWKPTAFFGTLTAAIAVSTRYFTVNIDDGVAPSFFQAPFAGQTASTTQGYGIIEGGALVVAEYLATWPGGYLKPGDRFIFATAGIQAADQWSAGKMRVAVWAAVMP
jgi:hypothetical protein